MGVGVRKDSRMDTLTNLLDANGHLLHQIFYLKVTATLSRAGCMGAKKCTGGHWGGRGWCIATVAWKWAPAKVFLFKFLILKKSYKGSTSWESSCTWLRSTRQGAGVYILPKNWVFYSPLDEMRWTGLYIPPHKIVFIHPWMRAWVSSFTKFKSEAELPLASWSTSAAVRSRL